MFDRRHDGYSPLVAGNTSRAPEKPFQISAQMALKAAHIVEGAYVQLKSGMMLIARSYGWAACTADGPVPLDANQARQLLSEDCPKHEPHVPDSAAIARGLGLMPLPSFRIGG